MIISVHLTYVALHDNNNEYLERLTRTGPKHLHVLYKYIFVRIHCIQHECTRTHTHANAEMHMRTHTQTHTHTPVAYEGNQGNETEEKFFKREMFSRKI